MTAIVPTLDYEAGLHAQGARYVIGCDEVGRGAIAGPVAVGMSVVDRAMDAVPEGLRDSKLLSEKRREELAPLSSSWCRFSAVGLASPVEVDELGIMAALALAGKRALTILHEAGADILDSMVLLDGHHDWLNPGLSSPLPLRTLVKADQQCASVAAASVIAKVHRDRLMIEADAVTQGYGWAGNKGYASSGHLAAIAELGPTDFHRRTWLRQPALFDELVS